MAQPSPHKQHTSLGPPPINPPAFPLSANPDFQPRKEFIKGHRVTSSFALLTLSGSSLVRLYRFPQPVTAAFQSLFEQHNIIQAVRQDGSRHFSEYTLAGKPWAAPNSLRSEKLIVDILTIILHHGFILLSSLDYGREQDDHLAISFSKPMLISAGTASTTALTNGSAISLNVPIRTPFAVSFLSATKVRVISPPLSNTPAVLQSVRGAWPGGVDKEGKVGEASYEFKFKGYKWYQEDTFAADSLHFILTMLQSLDGHGFSLLTSFTLSRRSKTRDFWVFTNSGDDTPPANANAGTTTTSPAGSNLELIRELTPPEGKKFATISNGRALPIPVSNTLANSRHSRSASDTTPVTSSPLKGGTSFSFGKATSTLLRLGSSKNPQPISPVSEVPESRFTSPEQSPIMGASSIGSCDMTGVGAGTRASTMEPLRIPEIVISTNQMNAMQTEEHNPLERMHDSPYPAFKRTSSGQILGQADARASMLPADLLHVFQSPGHRMANGDSPPHDGHFEGHKSTLTVPSQPAAPYLLAPDAFRDSAFSTQSSTAIPIAWTGKKPDPDMDKVKNAISNNSPMGGENPYFAGQEYAPPTRARNPSQRDSERNDVYRVTIPAIKEQPSKEGDLAQTIHVAMSLTNEDPLPHKQDVRVGSPRTMNAAVEGIRRSEKPSIVDGDGKSRSPPRRKKEKGEKKDKRLTPERLDSGWVMVNVEGSKKAAGTGSARSRTQSPPANRPSMHTRGSSDSQVPSSRSRSPRTPQEGNPQTKASMSAAAKTIAMIDAVDAKEQKEKAKANSPFKRLLGRGTSSNDADASYGPPGRSSTTLKRRLPEGTIAKIKSLEMEQAEERRGRERDVPAVRHRDTRLEMD